MAPSRASLCRLRRGPLCRYLPSIESPLKGRNWLWFAGATFFGGIVGPVFLLFGLTRTPASATSLLLNMESVLTILIAWFIFREHVGLRVALGATLIISGCVALSWTSHFSLESLTGPTLITAACAAWAIDNNLTRRISESDPLQIAMLKSLMAGATNILLAMMAGGRLPAPSMAALCGAVGFIGYGVSLICFIFALRNIGTARTGAIFALAPFAGAIASVVFLHDAVSWQFFAATALMAAGATFLLTERHEHEHGHMTLEHEHSHIHDEHHLHENERCTSNDAPHSHRHRHAGLRHKHPHFPDIHHRHSH